MLTLRRDYVDICIPIVEFMIREHLRMSYPSFVLD